MDQFENRYRPSGHFASSGWDRAFSGSRIEAYASLPVNQHHNPARDADVILVQCRVKAVRCSSFIPFCAR
jgi:hypothetical protein